MTAKLTVKIFILISTPLIVGCGGKKGPDPAPVEKTEQVTEVPEIFEGTQTAVQQDYFYELEESIADIKKEVDLLRAQVMEYEYKPTETDYTRQLKELIDNPPPAHKLTLNNGSVIEGTIEKDKPEKLIVKTDVGKLTINKSDIVSVKNLVLPTPDIVFIGHGQEETFQSYRRFTGKVLNQGSRRGDFVRIIYHLWGSDTDLIRSDSTFVEGSQIVYRSGIVTDTVLEPNHSAEFSLQVNLGDTVRVAYVTREVRWAMYD